MKHFSLFYNILSDCHESDEINYLLNAFRLKKLGATLPHTDFQTFQRPWAYDLGYEKAWFISRKFVS